MRTTITLDPDVTVTLKQKLRETKLTQKEILNVALRKGLPQVANQPGPPFKVQPHSFGLRPGFDRNKMNQLLDELNVEDFVRQRSHDRARR